MVHGNKRWGVRHVAIVVLALAILGWIGPPATASPGTNLICCGGGRRRLSLRDRPHLRRRRERNVRFGEAHLDHQPVRGIVLRRVGAIERPAGIQ